MQYNFSQNSQEIIIQFEIQNPQQLIIELTETSIFLTISSTNPIISGTLYSSIIVEKSTKNFDQKTKIFQFKLFKSNLSNWPFVIIKEHPKGYLDPHSEFLLSKYYESQRVFDKSLKYLLSSYNKGHRQSTIKLAMLYSFEYTGFPIEKDINKAFIFWKKAAFLGSSNAQFIVFKRITQFLNEGIIFETKFKHEK
ncbi:chronic myelogenous leukemia tumor antigen 66 [Anaeramoeba ignava]|uniref:Chronic myelogenous leukemia tumor antigen 66 n=1 Tax=Anaeramoeba ignava TaxID=1746090 RepID=A0A9Q0RFY5_ANAIG|nr:chronic myelogenous leukemia tumor antigen 66 [Anaeramoeba ignava]